MSRNGNRQGPSRRLFLLTSSRALLLGAGAGLAGRMWAQTKTLEGTLTGTVDELGEKIRLFPFHELDSYLTPVDKFFLRSHLEIPHIEPDGFRIQVGGWVERPFTITLRELERLPVHKHAVTFECTGTSVGGGMVSNGEWSGPLLEPLIQRARPKPGAIEVLMEGADVGLDEFVPIPLQYGRSVPLHMLKDMPALLALAMNGEALRPVNGYPVRVILPGHYGVQHVKWVVRLTVLDRRYRGFYQTQRYVGWRQTPAGIQVEEIERQRVKSQFARIEPKPATNNRVYQAVGAAWSGGHGIRQVEVSTDGGKIWNPATIQEPRTPYAWVLWTYEWSPSPGTHEVVARATDGLGRSQPLSRDPRVLTGYINNWCHRRTITVPA